MSSAAGQLDSRIEIVTPENIAFSYQLAGPFRRLLAYSIDVAIRAAILIAAAMGLLFIFGIVGAEGIGVGIVLLIWFALEWLYGALFETFWNGQTPGKRSLRLRVLTTEGQPINAMQAVLRNVVRAADAMPLVLGTFLPLYSLGLCVMVFNRRFQRLGDLAGGTIVVAEAWQRHFGVIRITDAAAIELAQSLPANFPVSRGLARALSAYVARRGSFSASRRAEIARTLGEPLSEHFNLPPGTASYDLLLLALYYRVFIADRGTRNGDEAVGPGGIPPLVAQVVGSDVSTTEATPG